MTTINNLLQNAIKYDEPLMAYSLYWAVMNNHCALTDYVDKFDMSNVDNDEVKSMIARNVLSLRPVNLYSMPTKEGSHLIVLAHDEKSARGKFLSDMGVLPIKVINMNNRMDTSFWYGEEEGYKSFREIKDELEKAMCFPYTVMNYQKEERTYEEVEHEYFEKRRKQGFVEIPFSKRPLKKLEEL